MSTALLYAGKHGATQGVAERVARELDGKATVARITRGLVCPPVDTVVIGAAIYGGKASGEVTAFVEAHRRELLDARVLLYVSCLYDGARAEQQLADSFPSWLVAHCSGRYYVGGRVEWARLGFFHRIIMKRIARITADVDRMRPDEIDRLIADLK